MVKLVRQLDINDCGMACALMILHHFSKTTMSLEEFKVKHHYARNELSFYELEKLLSSYQLLVEGYYLESFDDLNELTFPILVDLKKSNGENHYVILEKQNLQKFLVFDPDQSRAQVISLKTLKQMMNGNVLVFQNQKSIPIPANHFRFDWRIGCQLLARNWLKYLLLNLFDFLAILSLLFSSMFIKIMITNYFFFTWKQVIKVGFVIGCLILGWMGFSGLNLWLKKSLIKKEEQEFLHNLSLHACRLQVWLETNHHDFIFNQIQQSLNFRKALNQLLATVLACSGFAIFISYVLITFSKMFFFSSCLLIFLMIIVKGIKVKYFYSLSTSERFFNHHQQVLMHTIIRDYSTIIKKTNLKKYYAVKKVENKKLVQTSGWLLFCNTLEKLVVLGFYVLMFLTLNFQVLNLSSFLIFINIILAYNVQIDRFLDLIWLVKISRPSTMVFQPLSLIDQEKVVITFKQQRVHEHHLTITNFEKNYLLIDYQLLNVWLKTNQIYQTNQAVLSNELTSNNLFNFGSGSNLKLFQIMKMQTYLEKYALDLTTNSDCLNSHQKQLLAILSVCFCEQKIILIEKNTLDEYAEIKQQLIANLKDRILIFIED